jgi:hypothetical protein
MSVDTFADAFFSCDAPVDQEEDFLNNLMGFVSTSTFDESDYLPDLPGEVCFNWRQKSKTLKTNKKENKMDSQEWKAAIDRAIQFIERMNGPMCHRDREITLNDFMTESNQSTRFIMGKDAKELCKIFPWFHLPERLRKSYRFRQTLAAELRQGTTIDKVLEAMNYLLHLDFRQGNSLERLRECYEQMSVPISSHCLTAIVEVYLTMAPEATLAPGMTPTATSVSVPTPQSPSSLENVRCETPLEDFDPLHKRRRICTAHAAVEKNLEMIAFYEDILAAMPLDGPISARQIYQDIIHNLQKANEDLRTDVNFLF